MRKNGFFYLIIAASILNISAGASDAAAAPKLKLQAVAVDPLIKVFQDTPITGEEVGVAEAARGEHATFQVVVTSSPVELKDVRCEVTPFTHVNQTAQLPPPRVRYVGYVASNFSPGKPAKDQLRPAPAMYPYPLLKTTSTSVAAEHPQSATRSSVKVSFS